MKEESLILNSFFFKDFCPQFVFSFCPPRGINSFVKPPMQLTNCSQLYSFGWLSEAIDLKCLCTLSYLPPPNTIISRPNRPIFVSKGMPGSRQYGDELFIKKMFIQFLCFCFDLLFCSAHQILQGFLQDCQLPLSCPCSDLPFRQIQI